MESINSQALHDQRQREIHHYIKNFIYKTLKEARDETGPPDEKLADAMADCFLDFVKRERGRDEETRAKMQKIILDNKLILNGAEKLLIADKDMQEIGERLRTQDNRITAEPMFAVQEKRREVGYDSSYTDALVWVDMESGEYEEYDEKPDDGREYEQFGYKDIWHVVMVAFTEVGCQQYINLNGHNHRGELRIYAESFRRCPEMIAIRKRLMEHPKIQITRKEKKENAAQQCQYVACPYCNAAVDQPCISKPSPSDPSGWGSEGRPKSTVHAKRKQLAERTKKPKLPLVGKIEEDEDDGS